MQMYSDYRIYVGDKPGPTLQLVFDAGKLMVEYVAELGRKMQEEAERPPPEKGRINVTRLYGESVGRVYDAYRINGLAPASATTYARYIGKLFDWMDANRITKSVAEVEEEFIEFLVASRNSCKDPDAITMRRLAHYAIKKFLELCCDEESASSVNPPPPPVPKPVTSEGDLRSLFDHVRSPADMAMLIVTNGLEVSTGDAVNLTWDAFDSSFEYVTIGEGEDAQKQEIDPVYKAVLTELKSIASSPYVLADSGGDLTEPPPVTDRSLQYRFRRMARRSGIPEWTTLTTTRKADAIASDLLEEMVEKYLPRFLEKRKAAGDTGG